MFMFNTPIHGTTMKFFYIVLLLLLSLSSSYIYDGLTFHSNGHQAVLVYTSTDNNVGKKKKHEKRKCKNQGNNGTKKAVFQTYT